MSLSPEVAPDLWNVWLPWHRFAAGLILAAAVWLAGSAVALDFKDGARPAIDPTLVVDPNSAPSDVLESLPGLGPVLIGRIVAERARAPFASLSDFDRRVRGIGPAKAEALRPFFRFKTDLPGVSD